MPLVPLEGEKKMRILVTGGAGFIGSVTSEELMRAGHEVVVYDNLSEGHLSAVIEGAPFIQADLIDGEILRATLENYHIEAVIHLADSFAELSRLRPAQYHRKMLASCNSLLQAMTATGVKRIIFSSTAAVYGEPERRIIVEGDTTSPINIQGKCKLAIERILQSHAQSYDLHYAILRCFNVSGASSCHGEAHEPEKHLIPTILQAALGRRPCIYVHGDNYPTRDGTCVRDYVHVSDLARGYVLALNSLEERNRIYNLGCGGEGFSVREVIEAACEVTGTDIPMWIGPRRSGDAASLVASNDMARIELGWIASAYTLREIIQSAWDWMQQHPRGYEIAGLTAETIQ